VIDRRRIIERVERVAAMRWWSINHDRLIDLYVLSGDLLELLHRDAREPEQHARAARAIGELYGLHSVLRTSLVALRTQIGEAPSEPVVALLDVLEDLNRRSDGPLGALMLACSISDGAPDAHCDAETGSSRRG
jgi:hypothetical protein